MTRHFSRGFSLIELVLVVAIIGLTTLVAVRQLSLHLDRLATRDAVRSAGALVARARDEAVALHSPMTVRVDTASATLLLRSRRTTLARTPLGDLHGVRLSTTRDSITFDVRGLGYGAANMTLIARRGSA